jgi:glycosyltransferase involved in cell wall biosynthesis
MPLVSVVVPTHNRACLLHRTLASICAQQAVDLEIVVVDDGSVDDSAAIAAAADPRVSVIRNPAPLGVSRARNLGIARSRGDWISFCDDDDLWAPEKLATQLSAAEEAQAGWVYAGDVNVDDRLRVLSGSPPPDPEGVTETLTRRNPLGSGASNVMVRADVLATTGGFDPQLRRTEDWDLWLRLASTGPPAWVCRPLVAYRFHATNIVADVGSMVVEPQVIARRYDIAIDLAAMHRRAAWTSLRAGRRGDAIRHYAWAAVRGDVRSLARATFALVHPSVGSDALFGLLARDSAWIAQAECWLAAFVGQPVTGSSAVGIRG